MKKIFFLSLQLKIFILLVYCRKTQRRHPFLDPEDIPKELDGRSVPDKGNFASVTWSINTFLNTAVLAWLMGPVPCLTESTSLGMESGQAISYQ